MDKILHDLVYLNYRIYGTIIYLGHAEYCPSAVSLSSAQPAWAIGVTPWDLDDT